jgi:phosphoribosylanthranilate isomerase
MISVKICGITNAEDALCAAQSGAAAVGFIFYRASPRYIEPEKARSIIEILPPNLVKVGVFVNETAEEVKRIFDYCALDMLQLHGDESPDYCRQFSAKRVIKALELKSEEDLKTALRYDVAAILVDSRHAGLFGGTGKKADWDLARRISQPLILSGGLNEDNVGEALQTIEPVTLDINSGVEMWPGKKDSAKLVRIMEIIKAQALNKKTSIFIKKENS